MTQFKIDFLTEKRLYPLVRLIDKLSWIMLFALMAMTAVDLFLRNFTNASILGSVELTELMMVIIVFSSLAQCEVDDGHIRVELVMDKFSPKVRAVADVFTQALCTIIFALMSVSIFNHAVNMKGYGEVTMDLNLPLYPFIFIACLGCMVMTLVLFSKTIINIIKAVGS
ncbi:MAG: TRAP transporter small permease [Desulfobacula sp.]|nr:TRAP transporter small permease [Desulfobacula sp.]